MIRTMAMVPTTFPDSQPREADERTAGDEQSSNSGRGQWITSAESALTTRSIGPRPSPRGNDAVTLERDEIDHVHDIDVDLSKHRDRKCRSIETSRSKMSIYRNIEIENVDLSKHRDRKCRSIETSRSKRIDSNRIHRDPAAGRVCHTTRGSGAPNRP
jgi:hypothetical protein